MPCDTRHRQHYEKERTFNSQRYTIAGAILPKLLYLVLLSYDLLQLIQKTAFKSTVNRIQSLNMIIQLFLKITQTGARLKINFKFSSKPWKDTRLAFLLTFKHPRHHAIFILVLLFIEEKKPNEIIKSNQIKKTLLPKHDYCTHSVTDIYGIL